jgi:hypothetical protein
MNFKQKLLATSVMACFIATPAFANGLIEDAEDFIDNAIDLDDQLVSVVSGAFNFSTIDASVNLNAYTIDLTSNSASATATATAASEVEGAVANVTAIANAISGNSISTTAIGAFNNSSVTIANEVAYTVSLVSEDGIVIANNIIDNGNISGFGDGYGDGDSILNIFSAGEDYDVRENGIGLFQTAFNAADINASVNITASAPTRDSFWDRNRDFAENTISLSNISITTTAIGAYNAGVMDIANSLSQTLTVTQSTQSVDPAM